MTFKDLVADALDRRGVTYAELWKGLGYNVNTYTWKLYHDTITLEEFENIMKFLNYDVKITVKDLKSESEVFPTSKSPRIRQVIRGVKYDTSVMEFICRTPEINGTWIELLRLPSEGRYFIAFYAAIDEVEGLQLMEVDEMYAKDFMSNCGAR